MEDHKIYTQKHYTMTIENLMATLAQIKNEYGNISICIDDARVSQGTIYFMVDKLLSGKFELLITGNKNHK